jgi:hypothetical protein
MTAMPLFNRQPEAPHAVGLLLVLGLIVLVTVLRYFPFFLHEALGVR